MSEPVSKAEIEDVLSSIRRLVSENSGGLRREAEERAMPDKLVLTPALRVDEDTAEDPAPVSDTQEVSDATEDSAPLEGVTEEVSGASSLSPLEQRIAELEAVVARSAAEFEPDGSEDEFLPETFVFHHHVVEPRAEPEARRESEPEGEADADATVAEAPEVIQAGEVAEAAPGQDWQPEAWQPEDREPEPVEEPVSIETAAIAAAGPIEELTEDLPAQEVEADAEDWPPEDPARLWGETEEAASGEAWAEVQEAVSAEEDYASDDWEEVEIAETGDDVDEAVLDEEALRELVARMVREELQGTVGERITQNVRRMVRREIARALSLQEFD